MCGIKREEKLVDELIKILKEFTEEEIIEFEEKYDEQFKALEKLYETIETKETFIALVVLNALVSYQLTGTGEEYWWEFSNYFRNKTIIDPVNEMIAFLRNSKKNKRLTETKIKRLKQARPLASIIIEKEKEICQQPEKLINLLKHAYKSKTITKTFSFAVKMLHYACRIKYKIKKPMPKNIPIPQDIRVTRVSKRIRGHNITKLWDEIAKETNLAPLHIDSLIWISYGKIRRGEKIPNEKIEKLLRFLSKLISY